MSQKAPNLTQPPLQHRVDTHEIRPIAVRAVEGPQLPTVRICAPRTHEDGADPGVLGEVEGEGVAEGADW